MRKVPNVNIRIKSKNHIRKEWIKDSSESPNVEVKLDSVRVSDKRS